MKTIQEEKGEIINLLNNIELKEESKIFIYIIHESQENILMQSVVSRNFSALELSGIPSCIAGGVEKYIDCLSGNGIEKEEKINNEDTIN